MLLVINVLCIVQLQFVFTVSQDYCIHSHHRTIMIMLRHNSIKSDESRPYAQNAGASTKRVELNIIRMNFYVENGFNVLTYPLTIDGSLPFYIYIRPRRTQISNMLANTIIKDKLLAH